MFGLFDQPDGRSVLTTPDPASLNALMSASPSGMAHAARTGPEGKTCRECEHWARVAHHRYGDDHRLKPRPCREYTVLMRRTRLEVIGADVPAETPSCRAFAASQDPQPLVDPAWTLAEARRTRREARQTRAAPAPA